MTIHLMRTHDGTSTGVALARGAREGHIISRPPIPSKERDSR